MSQGTRLLIIIVIGAGLLLLLISNPRRPRGVPRLLPSAPRISWPSNAAYLPQDAELEQTHQEMKEAASGPWSRDPFSLEKEGVERIKTAADKTLANMRLFGIIWSAEGRRALINDLVVKTGDRIEGAVVKEIEADHLTLEKQGKRYTLRLQD